VIPDGSPCGRAIRSRSNMSDAARGPKSAYPKPNMRLSEVVLDQFDLDPERQVVSGSLAAASRRRTLRQRNCRSDGGLSPGTLQVHVVRDSVVRAPQKTRAPSTIAVNSGLLCSVENADHAASIREGAGRGVGPLSFAKVRVAGSNPVVRSKTPGQGSWSGRWSTARSHVMPIICPSCIH